MMPDKPKNWDTRKQGLGAFPQHVLRLHRLKYRSNSQEYSKFEQLYFL